MKDILQLVKKSSDLSYLNVYPNTFIDAIIDKLSGKSLSDILNSFNMYFLSYDGNIENARLQIPPTIRKKGLWVTYINLKGNVITEWYSNDSVEDSYWKNSDNWIDGSNMLSGDLAISSDGNWIINGINTGFPARGKEGITPMLRGFNGKLQVSYNNGESFNYLDLPTFVKEDNEDIKAVTDSTGIKELKLADKEYNISKFSGLGRVYLRKNVVNNKNVLTQEMIDKPNTIYIIQYDYDLDNKEINIPKNCILDFQGGSLNNGIINLNSCYIKQQNRIFDNIIFKGDSNNKTWYISSFKTTNLTESIQSLLDNKVLNLCVDVEELILTKPLYIKHSKQNIFGLNFGNGVYKSIIKPADNFKPSIIDNEEVNAIFYFKRISLTSIHNLYINGNYKVKYGIKQCFKTVTSCVISDNVLINFNIAAIAIQGTENCYINNNIINNCGVGIIASINRIDENNILNFNLEGGSTINILFIKNNYLTYCNYGFILNSGSDVYLDGNSISHSSLWALYIKGDLINIGSLYLEGNGHGLTWVDENGFLNNLNSQEIVPKAENWGTEVYINQTLSQEKYNIRAFCYFFLCKVNIKSIYISYRWVRTDINSLWNEEFNNTNKIGIDSFFICKNSKVVYDNLVTYNNNGSTLFPRFHTILVDRYPTIICNNLGYDVTKDPFIHLNGNIEVYNKYIYLSSGPHIYNNKELYFQPKEAYNLFSYQNNNVNIHHYIDDVLEYNNMCYFKIKQEYKFYRYRIPKTCFTNSLKYIHIYLFNIDNSECHISCRVESVKKASNYTKKLIYVNNTKISDTKFQFIIPINSFYLEDSDYIEIEIKNGNNTIPYNENIYVSIPYIIDYTKTTDCHIENEYFFVKEGNFNQKPIFNNNTNIGFGYFCTDKQTAEGTTNGIMIYHKGGNVWIDSNGLIVDENYPALKIGTTAQRPTGIQIGFTYKDTDLNKWIIWNGEAWENIDGTALG